MHRYSKAKTLDEAIQLMRMRIEFQENVLSRYSSSLLVNGILLPINDQYTLVREQGFAFTAMNNIKRLNEQLEFLLSFFEEQSR